MMSKNLHILIVSQCFYPEVFRINDIASEWVNRGYKVTAVTSIPNYPKGEYFDGYSKTEKREEDWNGIHIIHLPIEPRKTGSKNLIRNYLSFVHQGKKWVRKTNIEADVVFTYETSPMTQALVSVKYAKKRKIPHILYVTDMWPENVVAVTGIHNPLIIGPVQKMVDYIYKHSSYILTSSKSFISAIKKRKVSESKLEFWPQYAEDFYKPAERISEAEIPDDGVCNLVFAGNIGFAQGLGLLPKAADKLREKGVVVRFVIIGDGRYMPTLRNDISDLKVEDYFHFIDRKPAEEIPAYLAAADALLITLSKNDVFSITIPAKTQSCLACGRPIIVSADGEVQQIIKEANAGLVSDSEDVDGFVDNVIALSKMSKEKREELGKNALAYSKANFDKEELLNRIDQILQGGFNVN